MDARGTSLTIRQTAALIVLFWLAYFLTAAASAAVNEFPEQWEMMGNRSLVAVIGMTLTVPLAMVLYHYRRVSTVRLVAIGFAASVPIAIGYAAGNYLVFQILSPLESMLETYRLYPEKLGSPWRNILGSAIGWYYFIATWALLYISLTYAERVRAGERRMAALTMAAQAAELRALRYQINPHFLFNAINAISSLVLSGRSSDAERMLLNLSEYFRAGLADDPAADVTLADEFEMQRLYLAIEQVRFPDQLFASMDLPDTLGTARVPGLILQPLVENTVTHGVSRSASPVTVSIHAWTEDGALHIVVEDDARSEEAPTSGHGIGLRNVRDRLAARYGERASLTITQQPNRFRVEIVMPSDG